MQRSVLVAAVALVLPVSVLVGTTRNDTRMLPATAHALARHHRPVTTSAATAAGADDARTDSALAAARDAAHVQFIASQRGGNADVSVHTTAAAPSATPGSTLAAPVTTRVDGGLTSAPALIPTYFNKDTFEATGLCPEQWVGSWSGESTCTMTAGHFDSATGDVRATLVDVFSGVWTGDGSNGSLTINEDFIGNLYTGAGVLNGIIANGQGDPAFQCSRGHVRIDVLLTVPASYGGYDGEWTHGCPAASYVSPAPVPATMPLIAGGVLSIPTGIPTGGSIDGSTLHATGLAPEEWTGPLSGASMAEITSATFDSTTGDLTGHVVETFHGTYLADHSQGTLVVDEIVTGNLFTGAGFINGTVVDSSGDPTFRCWRGTIDFPFFLNGAGSFGGYEAVRTPIC